MQNATKETQPLPRKGNRVKFSAEGLKNWKTKSELRGTVTGNATQRHGLVRVKWDSLKTPDTYHGSFVELADAPQ
jgi:hypothetical protein